MSLGNFSMNCTHNSQPIHFLIFLRNGLLRQKKSIIKLKSRRSYRCF